MFVPGLTAILKSVTVTEAGAAATAAVPFAATVALLDNVPTAVGVRLTFTVAFAPTPSVPIRHVDVLLTIPVQDPGVLVIESAVVLGGRASLKTTLEATSVVDVETFVIV